MACITFDSYTEVAHVSSLLKFFPLEIMVAGLGGTFQKALASYIYVAMQSEKVQKNNVNTKFYSGTSLCILSLLRSFLSIIKKLLSYYCPLVLNVLEVSKILTGPFANGVFGVIPNFINDRMLLFEQIF